MARPPEEVFDIIFKLGEGSYGSVFKAIHKESGSVSTTAIEFREGNGVADRAVIAY